MSAQTEADRLNEQADEVYAILADMVNLHDYDNTCENCGKCFMCKAKKLVNWIENG